MTFRLKTLLVFVGAICVALYVVVAAPPAIAVIAIVSGWVAWTAFLTSGIVYARASLRAFCIGALFPAGGTVLALIGLLWIWFFAAYEIRTMDLLLEHVTLRAFTFRVWSTAGAPLSLLTGLAAVWARVALSDLPKEPRTADRPSSRA